MQRTDVSQHKLDKSRVLPAATGRGDIGGAPHPPQSGREGEGGERGDRVVTHTRHQSPFADSAF